MEQADLIILKEKATCPSLCLYYVTKNQEMQIAFLY